MRPLILSLFLLNCTNIKEKNKIHIVCITTDLKYEADVDSLRRDGSYWVITVDSKTSIRLKGDCSEE